MLSMSWFPFQLFIKALFNQFCHDTFITVINGDSFQWVEKRDSLNANVTHRQMRERQRGWPDRESCHPSVCLYPRLSSQSRALIPLCGPEVWITVYLAPSAGWNQNMNFICETCKSPPEEIWRQLK